MRGTAFAALAAVAVCAASIAGSAFGEIGRVVTYPAPPGQPLNDAYSIEVRPVGGDWQRLDAYKVTVDRDTYSTAAMVGFDAGGPVDVAITKMSGGMQSARVRPLSYGITPTISADGRTATFTLPQPLNVSFEVNGDILHNVHVFASPIETDIPQASSKVIAFGRGIHPIAGDHVLHVPSNTTVYIAGGAVLLGSLEIAHAANVIVRGRGIIDPSSYFLPRSRPTILVEESSHVGIRDVTLLRAQDGGVTVADSSDVVIAGIREITTDHSSDGIDVDASQDVLIDGAFLRTSDDSIAVYATTPSYGRGGTRDVTVRNSTLWADIAHPFLAGTHGNPADHDVIERIDVQNVDILEHDEYRGGDLYQGALAVNAGDRVTVRNVRFDDVRIEDFSRGQVVNVKVFRNPVFNKRVGMGVDRVFFRNVSYYGEGDSPSRIRGYMPSRRVTNVTFENFSRNGAIVLDPVAGNVVIGPYASNIDFRKQPPTRSVGDAAAAIRYSGRWLHRAHARSDAGDVHTPLRPGAGLTYEFHGRQARVYGLTGPGAGKADVFVDGSYATTVDTYSDVSRQQQIWFDTGVLRVGSHTLELRYSGAKNVLATAAAIGFDKLEVVR